MQLAMWVTGGSSRAVTVALLLPPDTQMDFVDVMKGAERAAARYGAIIAGGGYQAKRENLPWW